MKTKILAVVTTSIFLISCAQDKINEPKEGQDGIVFLPPTTDFWSMKGEDRLLAESYGSYDKYHIPTDYFVSVYGVKADPIQDYYLSSYDGIYNGATAFKTRTLPAVNPMYVTADGISLDRNIQTRSAAPDLSELYGKTVKFKFESTLTRSGGDETEVDLYVPELLTITGPTVTKDSEMYPWCYYDNFIIRWNADEKNTSGLIVVVEWLGTMMYGYDHPDMFMRRTDFIPVDNGQAVLNPELLKDIPDTALCYLTLMRGNTENVLVGDHSYKIMGESHAVLPFVLVRHIKYNPK